MILIRNIQIPLPFLEKQREIVEKLDSAFAEIESLKERIKTEMDFSSSLRKSLLSSAFIQENEVA
jgi:restriction endonuclease S subunit